MPNRWWIYQRERFPVVAHAPLIAAFSFSAISYSSMLCGAGVLPAPGAAMVAFFSALLSFLQLRLADEFKDFEEDLLSITSTRASARPSRGNRIKWP
jgi:4-hydroxybenzoate polyprenyltransferase